MLEAVREFGRPKDFSGVRSFFGLIEQVFFAISKTEVMAPFRQLLSPKVEVPMELRAPGCI